MVVKANIKIVIILLFFLFSCKDDRTSKKIILNKKVLDSIALEKKREAEYKITTANNRKILNTIKFENRVYDKENDFSNIKSVLLKTPRNIEFTHLEASDYDNETLIFSFVLNHYLEYKEPYIEYCPFINNSTKKMEFILSYDYLKVSFSNGQYFWLGRDYKWLTPIIKLPSYNDDYQFYNENIEKNINEQAKIHGGTIIRFKEKRYLVLYSRIQNIMIHHLFDITSKNKIKYYVLSSIDSGYDENCYGDSNHDGKLDFKQKYAYLRNIYDKSEGKYKIYTLP